MSFSNRFNFWPLCFALMLLFTTVSCSLIKTSGTAVKRIGQTLDEMGDEEGREGTFVGKSFNFAGGLYTTIGETVEDTADRGEKGESKGALFVDANKRVVKGAVDEMNEFSGEPEGGEIQMSKAEICQVQEKLKDAGYDPGTIDGDCGKRTRKALRAYQKDNGLVVNGEIDEPTLKALGLL